MSTINKDIKQLDSIANAYSKTKGDMKEMWKQKWYKLSRMWQGDITKCIQKLERRID